MAEQKAEKAKKDAAPSEKKDRSRSPAYPAFALSEAIQKARVLWEKEGRNWTPVQVAGAHWGFTPKSSSGIRATAALMHYGLVEDTGSKATRKIRLTDRAHRILNAPPEREAERDAAIRQAALSPKLYDTVWRRYNGKLPSDHSLEFDLQSDGLLNKDVIAGFIKDFRATVQFAKLAESATLSGDNGAEESANEERGEDVRDPADDPSRRQKVDRMPDTQRGRAMDFPIPLLGGGVATLRLPVPLSKAEYTHMQKFLTAMLAGMEPAVTREPAPAPDPNDAAAST